MVTVSTSKSEPRSYHHGDLRTALVETGLAMLETGGDAALSLRALAREVGVSPTAVYRHFPDKRALLAALSQAGLAMMGSAQEAAAGSARSDIEALNASGREYVAFAMANPALFRLIFTHAEFGGGPTVGNDRASILLRAIAGRLAQANPALTEIIILRAWALAHGVAMLVLDQRIPHDPDLIARILDFRTLLPRA